jgi:uncharacterized protein (DUF58 family)
VVFFSEKIEKFIPPKKGRSHILRIISELIDFEPAERGTDISGAIRYMTNAIKKRCTAFVISDFIQKEENLENALSIANNRHDVVALRIYDEREAELPNIGMVKLKDAETGTYAWIDSSDRRARQIYRSWWNDLSGKLDTTFRKSRVDYVSISTNHDYVKALISLFKKRG